MSKPIKVKYVDIISVYLDEINLFILRLVTSPQQAAAFWVKFQKIFRCNTHLMTTFVTPVGARLVQFST